MRRAERDRSLIARLVVPTILALLAAATARAGATPADWNEYASQATETRPARRFPHMDCFERAAKAHGVPLTLLLAVARGESDFDARARSRAEALGVMQIRWPLTARHLGITRRADLFDPCTNIDAGARYLAELMDRYPGDLRRAVAAYNYGPGRIRADVPLPAGARWYTDYILRHLRYVVSTEAGPRDYTDERRQPVLRFARPYRARAFADGLSRRSPGLRLDVFRTAEGDFQVVLLTAGEAEYRRARRTLRRLGFEVPAS
jgi:soluble lytic murein transglycosylase-like protein